MMARWLSGISTAALALVLAAPQASAQLTGQVTSAEEGTMEGVVVSAKRADSNITVSMISYAQVSNPLKPQRRVDQSRAANPERFRKQAEFLASINLSKSDNWSYELKTLPRVKGRSANVIITEYDLPRPTIEPHDVIVIDGDVWYTN